MSFHYFKSQDNPGKLCKLSDVINPKHLVNGDLLNLDHLNISELDKIPGCYLKVTKLNLTYNRLTSLSGLAQFKNLTHIFLSSNQIEHFGEIEKIPNKEQVVVLTIESNPISTHPDLVPLSLLVFPRLVEVNGKRITDHARQDLLDGIELSKQVVLFMSKNEILLQGLEKDLKSLKAELQNSQSREKRSFEVAQSTEAEGLKGKRAVKVPELPKLSYQSKIRPYMILDLIDLVGKSAHYYLNDEVDLLTQEKVFKWLFCEILLNLHSWGSHELQSYLQSKANHSDPDACFDLQLKLFQSMKFKFKGRHNFMDIFPNEALNLNCKSGLIASYFEETEDWTAFPVFSLNSEYLKAMMMVLQLQTKQLEELSKEKEDLLTFDATVLNVPGLVGKFNEGNRNVSYDFSQDLRASSRTTVKRYGSPINLSPSPNENIDQTEYKRKAGSIDAKTDESLEKTKIIEMRMEVESEKLRLEHKKKELEDKERLAEELRMEKLRENQKKIEMIRKKFEGIVRKGLEVLERALNAREKNWFDGILLGSLDEQRGECGVYGARGTQRVDGGEIEIKREKIERAKKFLEFKLMKKGFGPLRYFQVLGKAKRIRAEEFYNGKSVLDHFYKWKVFLKEVKKEKKAELDRKNAVRDGKNKEKLEFKQELEKLLKRIISNEKNMKRIMRSLKEKRVKFDRDCICGGFKCQVCLQEKTNFINTELKAIKSELIKSKRKQKNSK